VFFSCVTQVSCPPWKLIFTCRAVYALLLQALLDGTGFYIIYTCYPMYMKTILNYDVKQVITVFTMNMLFQNNGARQRLNFLTRIGFNDKNYSKHISILILKNSVKTLLQLSCVYQWKSMQKAIHYRSNMIRYDRRV